MQCRNQILTARSQNVFALGLGLTPSSTLSASIAVNIVLLGLGDGWCGCTWVLKIGISGLEPATKAKKPPSQNAQIRGVTVFV